MPRRETAAGPLLGAHVPVAGGLAQGPRNGRAIGAEAIQIFTRNQVQWAARRVEPEEARDFARALAESGVRVVVAHGSYLVNLASPEGAQRERSLEAFAAELERCHALGVERLVFHPGNHLGAGEDAALTAVARGLDQVLARAPGWRVRPLLEVTAGQGTSLGHRFEHLAEILARSRQGARLGVCLDTCHLFAAGYDISTPRGYEATLERFDRIVGLDRLGAVHLNDAKRGLGSRLDRHAAVGAGCLGLPLFRRVVDDPRFAGVPLLLETPGPLDRWKRELELLKGMRRLHGARPA